MSGFRDNRYWVLLLLGFFAGLPAALTAGTLQAWFTDAGLDLRVIGGVTLLILPYSLRFLWAPVFDEVRLPGFDRRRGWLFLIQTGLVLSILMMAFMTPGERFGIVPWLIVPAFMASFLAASQEMVINAWQTEVFDAEERGFSAGVYVTGWRVGAIVSGGVALILAAHVGWHSMYLMMAALMMLAPFVTLFAPRVHRDRLPRQQRLMSVMWAAIRDFFRHIGFKAALILLLIIMTYKLGDALALALNTTFLLRKMDFSLETIGLVNKSVSLISALVGGLFGGLWMRRMSLYRALILFAVIQTLSHFGYIVLAFSGKSLNLLVMAAFFENFCSGMGTVVLLALIMNLCRVEYTATQLALFNAVAYMPRVVVGPLAASLVSHFGWGNFFGICMLASLLPVLFVRLGRRALNKLQLSFIK